MNSTRPPAYRRLIFAMVASFACGFASAGRAQSTEPATTTTTAGPSPLTSTELSALDALSLGPQFHPADEQKNLAAHTLIERFFADPPSRNDTIDALTATKIDPNILGRLCEIRMKWSSIGAGVYYINERVGTNTAAYFLGIPPTYHPTAAWPLVIELPTASAFATTPKPDADRVTEIYTAWVNDEIQKHPDALVLMPLLNLTTLYGPTPEGINSVIAPLQHVASVVHVDPTRVYLFGFAMSSIAAWDIALHQGTYFAAFDSLGGTVRGDWQRLRVMDLRNTLPVIWQDDNDPVAPVSAGRQIADSLRRLKCDVDYQETHDLGHVPGSAIVTERYNVMRKRVRALYPARVTLQSDRQEPIYNRLDWVRIDQQLQPGKERRLILENGAGRITLNDKTFKVDATIDRPNHITVVTDNVASFRLFLNDQMVDFTRTITVIVNGRGRFEAMVTPTVREMLMDQLTIGRGWRYFTGHIDIDLTAQK